MIVEGVAYAWQAIIIANIIKNDQQGNSQNSGSTSNDMTALPDAGKPTNTGHPPADLSDIPNHTGSPVLDQNKSDVIIDDPMTDTNQGWTDEGFTINPDANGNNIFTATGEPPPNLSPDGAERNGAFREAKRYVGVPVSQQPESIGPNINKQGQVVGGKDYVYTPSGQDAKFIGEDGKIHIREDADGHVYIDDPTQNRGPHFNTEDGAHFDYKK